MDVPKAGGGAAASKVGSRCARTIKLRCACSAGACLWVVGGCSLQSAARQEQSKRRMQCQIDCPIRFDRCSLGASNDHFRSSSNKAHARQTLLTLHSKKPTMTSGAFVMASPIPLHVRIRSGTSRLHGKALWGLLVLSWVRVRTNDPEACRNVRHSAQTVKYLQTCNIHTSTK